MNMPIPMVKKPLLPTADQQRVLARIAAQRERLAVRRSQRAQSLVAAAQAGQDTLPDASLLLRLAVFMKQHPVAVAALAGVALAAGPRRLVRWGSVVLPLVMRLRSR